MTPYLKKAALFPPLIAAEPAPDLAMVVVIPAYREEKLLRSLQSLKDCQSPDGAVEVIVVINDSEKDPEAVYTFHREKFAEAKKWAAAHNSDHLAFHIIYQSKLPAKHAGVGLARKIGMDEAVFRLEKVGRAAGVLLCFDADSSCQSNYLRAVEDFFLQNPKAPAAAIHFEHPLSGAEFAPEIYQAIIAYELHLHYYIQMQRWAGFPLAFHTVGSSMAVRAGAYQAQGGMNRRKAGEDFYFLHKFTADEYFGEINNTKLIPSPRKSDRVPFGTGKSIQEITSTTDSYLTYAPDTFADLKLFLAKTPLLYRGEATKLWKDFPESVCQFFPVEVFVKKVAEIKSNTTSELLFVKRFYQWFNAFLLMKYVHFCRDHFYPNISVNEAVNHLLGQPQKKLSNLECLQELRSRQVKGMKW